MTEKFDWTQLFNKKRIWLIHILLWATIFCLLIVFEEYPEWCKGAEIICMVLQITVQVLTPCYTQVFLVWPFFARKNYTAGISLYIIQIVLLIYLLPYLLNTIGWIFRQFFPIDNWIDWTQEHIAFNIIVFSIVANFFKIAFDKLILDKQLKDAELANLKAQLNPHFLFNTLNNLYGLSIAQSEKLPEMMLKLSELLRYSLYRTNDRFVRLKDELNYIRNYIELERLRLSKNIAIQFEINGTLVQQQIAPLILISFIENAFKHQSSSTNDGGFIKISFNLMGSSLQLIVENPVDVELHKQIKDPVHTGIGLKNVRQRLDLLYSGKHQLKTGLNGERYRVELNLDLG